MDRLAILGVESKDCHCHCNWHLRIVICLTTPCIVEG
jgi:hypothetical protein